MRRQRVSFVTVRGLCVPSRRFGMPVRLCVPIEGDKLAYNLRVAGKLQQGPCSPWSLGQCPVCYVMHWETQTSHALQLECMPR
jgi:hypothetical protein